MAKITSIVDANPDPNNTTVPTGVAPFGQFTITAAAHNNSQNGVNDVILSGVIFNITSTNVYMDGSAFRFYNKADSTIGDACTAYDSGGGVISTASGSYTVRCDELIASSVNTEVDQGGSATFVLEGEVTNPQASASATSTLQVSIQNFNSNEYTSFGTSASHFWWQDKDSATCSAAMASGTSTCGNFLWTENENTVVRSTSYRS